MIVTAIASPAEATYWLIPGRILFLALHLLGVACFAWIVAKRLAPLRRGQRDFRFDRPWARLGRVVQYWLGQWRHPRYRGRRHASHADLRRIPGAGDARGLAADSRRLARICDARNVRKSWPYLRHCPGLRHDGRLPLHGGRGGPAAGLQARAVRSAGPARQRSHGRRHLPVGVDCDSHGGRQPVRGESGRGPGTAADFLPSSWRPSRCRGSYSRP